MQPHGDRAIFTHTSIEPCTVHTIYRGGPLGAVVAAGGRRCCYGGSLMGPSFNQKPLCWIGKLEKKVFMLEGILDPWTMVQLPIDSSN
ncbi:hypothetical protein L1049_016806 [Liquidambar formosana]|uniref:Uncharacterized protein n=1 Tax=Liquidambar formosana TaxID=63359 RepID=A0AAP0X726_LIQFO